MTVLEHLNSVDYKDDVNYIPSTFALKFVNFIKLVNGGEGESNTTPVVHLKMLDLLAGKKVRLANLCSRGFGKTVLFSEYLFLYIAVMGKIDGFGDITGAIYVSDSIENGVKSLRKNIEYRYHNSKFLQQYLTKVKFTDVYIEFTNTEGHMFGVRSFGAKTGMRGTKIMGKRPVLAVLDDLVSDDDARSPTVMSSIEDTVYKGVDYALDPTRRKIVFSGTPFNQRDILYKAVESGGWHVNVFPICEKFPVSREEFKGAWEDRFSYDYVNEQYKLAIATGQLSSFNQELMLRIISEEDRLISDGDIKWYSRQQLLKNKDAFNFYITTDFATSEKDSADFSVISVWALNNKGDWFWVDGICEKQLMSDNIKDLFRLAQEYNPQLVGVEISGQQKGFISWIQQEMISKNIWFSLAKDSGSNTIGIRPVTDKMKRFMQVEPWFKAGTMYFPEEMKNSGIMVEAMEELTLITPKKFQSKHDDFIDTISMLAAIDTFRPSQETGNPSSGSSRLLDKNSSMWDEDTVSEENEIDSYVV